MSKTKILIIEDDAEISRLMAMYLDVEGFDSKIVDDGLLALDSIKSYNPDLIVLDLMLPGMPGIDICKQARTFYAGPLLVLTACDDDVSEVSLLKVGADDFLTKPLKPHVLVARINALMRRAQPVPSSEVITITKLHINRTTQIATFKGKTLNLTAAEYEMLTLLEDNIGRPVSRNDCCKALRGINYDLNDRSIDMRISGLRKKMSDDQVPYKVITTVRNKGYMLFND